MWLILHGPPFVQAFSAYNFKQTVKCVSMMVLPSICLYFLNKSLTLFKKTIILVEEALFQFEKASLHVLKNALINKHTFTIIYKYV